ncbi:hypothetical protein BY996DRAFT_8686888 [Phakopsora pachyrhizi]|nr:hypothetical protein BY996DRAFT_8686888 [Phakopsora pachyrhizi]
MANKILKICFPHLDIHLPPISQIQIIIMELSEDEPLYSSNAECNCPNKSHKNDAINHFSNSTLLGSGSFVNFNGAINAPNDINNTIYKPRNVAEHIQSPKPRYFGEKTHTKHVSGNQTSSTLSTTEPSENLGNNPLELLLLSFEACLEIDSGQDLFIQELARKKLSEKFKEWKQKFLPYTFGDKDNEAQLLVATENLLVGKGNPEQPIPRLIELAKMWAAPKGTSYSNKEIKETIQDVNVQQRFALLCVCVTHLSAFLSALEPAQHDQTAEKPSKKTYHYYNLEPSIKGP